MLSADWVRLPFETGFKQFSVQEAQQYNRSLGFRSVPMSSCGPCMRRPASADKLGGVAAPYGFGVSVSPDVSPECLRPGGSRAPLFIPHSAGSTIVEEGPNGAARRREAGLVVREAWSETAATGGELRRGGGEAAAFKRAGAKKASHYIQGTRAGASSSRPSEGRGLVQGTRAGASSSRPTEGRGPRPKLTGEDVSEFQFKGLDAIGREREMERRKQGGEGGQIDALEGNAAGEVAIAEGPGPSQPVPVRSVLLAPSSPCRRCRGRRAAAYPQPHLLHRRSRIYCTSI